MMSEKDEQIAEFMKRILTEELAYLGSINIEECDAGDFMEIMISAHNIMETAKVIRNKLIN